MLNPVDVEVGQRIRNLRNGRNMTEEALAARIGVTFIQVRRFERGTSRATIGKLREIAQALDAPLSAFFEDAGNDNLLPLEIMTKQGLALLKAFRSISDVRLRHQALRAVEALASSNAEHPQR